MALPKPQLGTTKLLVVAIDLGTTYSGYAFSFRDDPLRISTHTWTGGSGSLQSLKTSTCVLLNPDKEFHSFGYEAEDMYSELAELDQHHGWYFFRRFKMLLYDTEGITADTTIEDIAGHTMPALTIFEHSIRYLKDHCLNYLKNQHPELDEADIQYVLTAPAIWDDKAKSFMRKAAIQAGINSLKLLLALEPEAASMWCQVESEKGSLEIGSKYMVVDLGGGTVDITVHERNEDGTLEELDKSNGGPWGGTEVDKNFERFLFQIYGVDEEFKSQEMGDYLFIMRSFEVIKRKVGEGNEGVFVFRIPSMMPEKATKKGIDINKNIESFGFAGKCRVFKEKLFVEKSVVQEWFKYPVDSIIRRLKVMFMWSEINVVSSILLVGGFSESPHVQEAIRLAFPGKKVIIPRDAGLAVLNGAVRFGHFPYLIAVRKSNYSYGLEICSDFDPLKHPVNKRREVYGKMKCFKIFREIVSINQNITYGECFTLELKPISTEQKEVLTILHASQNVGTQFVDEDGCRKVGELMTEYPVCENISDRRIKVHISFWDTEIKCQVEICKTGKRYDKKFALL